MLTQEQIEAKIADLTKAREQVIALARQQIHAIDNQVAALQFVLTEPKKEENVREFPGGAVGE